MADSIRSMAASSLGLLLCLLTWQCNLSVAEPDSPVECPFLRLCCGGESTRMDQEAPKCRKMQSHHYACYSVM